MSLPIIVFAVFALLIIIGAIFGNRAEHKRVEELTAVASELGWSFDPSRDGDHRRRFEQFSVFKRGDQDRYAYNRMAGRWPPASDSSATRLDCLAGDYHYETESTDSDGDKSTTSHRFSYLLVRMPFPMPSDIKVRPENWGDKIGAFMGFDDIDFESAEFSKRFHVTGEDKRFVYDVIHPRMIDFLISTTPGPFELAGGWLCVLGVQRLWQPAEFKERVEWVSEFLEHWPRHLQST